MNFVISIICFFISWTVIAQSSMKMLMTLEKKDFKSLVSGEGYNGLFETSEKGIDFSLVNDPSMVIKVNPSIFVSIDKFETISKYYDDRYNSYGILIKLDEEGTKEFEVLSKRNLEQRIPIILNDKMLSAPLVYSAISNGEIAISGFQDEETIDQVFCAIARFSPNKCNEQIDVEINSVLFSCFDTTKTLGDWFDALEHGLIKNKIINSAESEIYMDLHLISIFDSYNSEFNFSQREIINQIYNDNGVSMSMFSKNDQCFKEKSQIVKEKTLFKELLRADAVFFRKIDSIKVERGINFTTKEEEFRLYRSIAKEIYADQYFNDQDFRIFLLMQLYYYFNKDEFKKVEAQRENLHQIEDTEETVPIIDDERNN